MIGLINAMDPSDEDALEVAERISRLTHESIGLVLDVSERLARLVTCGPCGGCHLCRSVRELDRATFMLLLAVSEAQASYSPSTENAAKVARLREDVARLVDDEPAAAPRLRPVR